MGVETVGLTVPDLEKSLGKWIQQVTIETAERVLREEVGRGFDNEPVVVTDGAVRRDYHGVKIGGRIEFIRRPVMADAVIWALRELARVSPVKTGRYVSSHVVLLNRQEITGNLAVALRNVKDGDRVQIVNTQPYARKLEGATASKRGRGRAARKGSSRQARNGIYRVVHRALVQRFGRSMFFDFTYSKLNTGVKVWGATGGGSGGKRVQRDQVYPTLSFFIKPTGLPNEERRPMSQATLPIASAPIASTGSSAPPYLAGDSFRDAVRYKLDDILAALPWITWPHKDTLNTGVKPDASTGYFEIEFPGGSEAQYTFGAPGFNLHREQGQITIRAVVRQNAGRVERNKAEVYIEAIRSAFRTARIPAGDRTIRITATGAMGGGFDEGGMWSESIALEYQLFNTG